MLAVAHRRGAHVITRTLRDVYGAPHPAFLVYVAQDAEEEPVAVESLATAGPIRRTADVLPPGSRP